MSCGVIQDASLEVSFRIPMRGYEKALMEVLRTSPQFRIPMRGYEAEIEPHFCPIHCVPNPHEGL